MWFPAYTNCYSMNCPWSWIPSRFGQAGKGTAKVRLLGVDLIRTHYEQTPVEKVRQLEDQIEQLQDELRVLGRSKGGFGCTGRLSSRLCSRQRMNTPAVCHGAKTTVEDQAKLDCTS
jgi:hypothetical protein